MLSLYDTCQPALSLFCEEEVVKLLVFPLLCVLRSTLLIYSREIEQRSRVGSVLVHGFNSTLTY